MDRKKYSTEKADIVYVQNNVGITDSDLLFYVKKMAEWYHWSPPFNLSVFLQVHVQNSGDD